MTSDSISAVAKSVEREALIKRRDDLNTIIGLHTVQALHVSWHGYDVTGSVFTSGSADISDMLPAILLSLQTKRDAIQDAIDTLEDDIDSLTA